MCYLKKKLAIYEFKFDNLGGVLPLTVDKYINPS